MKLKILIVLFMLFLTYQGTQAQNFTHRVPSPSMKAHRDVQYYNSFPKWERKQPRIRRKAAKAAVKQHRRIVRSLRKIERILRFEDRSRSRIIRTH